MNKREIINYLNNEFARRRSIAELKADANLEKARENEDFAQNEQRIRLKKAELGKCRAENDKQNTEKLKKELEKLQNEQIIILKNLKLSENDLLPHYLCSICNDTGKTKDGYCECYKKELYQMLLENTGSKIDLASFDDFDEQISDDKTQQKQLSTLKSKFQKYVEDYPNVKNHIILIVGTPGVGKTFITECTAHAMIKRGKLVSFISAFGMNNNFLKYHTEFNENKETYLSVLTEPDLLVIDDLGTEPILKNVTINYLSALINERSASKKATIITTNLAPNQILERYGERVFSRIVNKADGEMYLITGEDLRKKKK